MSPPKTRSTERPSNKYIADLDTAIPNREALKRRSTENHAIVCRPAQCVTNGQSKENDDTLETLAIQKLNVVEATEKDSEDELSDLDLNLERAKVAPSLCVAEVSDLDESPPIKSSPKSSKSSGRGQKRKKTKSVPKKKTSKRQRVLTISEEQNEPLEKYETVQDMQGEVTSIVNDRLAKYNTHKNVYKYKVAVGDGKQKKSTKGGNVSTQQSPALVINASRGLCLSFRRGTSGGGGGDDGGEDKHPRKPPDRKICGQAANPKQRKRKKAASREGNSKDGADGGQEKSDDVATTVLYAVQSNSAAEGENPTESSLMELEYRKKWSGEARDIDMKSEVLENQVEEPPIQDQPMQGPFTQELPMQVVKGSNMHCDNNMNRSPRPNVVQEPTPTYGAQDKTFTWKNKSFEGLASLTHFEEGKHYSIIQNDIGHGGHGAVYNVNISDSVKRKCFPSSCREVVVKKVASICDDECKVYEVTSNHPNFVQTFFVMRKEPCEYQIFMEKCEKSLWDYIENRRLDMDELMFYWHQVLMALLQLHRSNAIHKDIKAQNVLLSIQDNMVRVKLADFDTVVKLDDEFTAPGQVPQGTRGCMSPEVWDRKPHGRPADVWNVAMFLMQLLFPKEFLLLQRKLKQNICGYALIMQKFLTDAWAELCRIDLDLGVLIARCLSGDQLSRPTIRDLLEDPAVTKYAEREVDMAKLIQQICPNMKS